jgi:PAS domain S-box-containing protein
MAQLELACGSQLVWVATQRAHLPQLLLSGCPLNVLSLANNDMDDKDLTALLEQLRLTGIPVGSLDLSGCSRLTDAIATDLAAWVRTSHSLQELKLAGTGIRTDAVLSMDNSIRKRAKAANAQRKSSLLRASGESPSLGSGESATSPNAKAPGQAALLSAAAAVPATPPPRRAAASGASSLSASAKSKLVAPVPLFRAAAPMAASAAGGAGNSGWPLPASLSSDLLRPGTASATPASNSFNNPIPLAPSSANPSLHSSLKSSSASDRSVSSTRSFSSDLVRTLPVLMGDVSLASSPLFRQVDDLPSPAVITNCNGMILHANTRLLRLLGYALEEMQSRDVAMLLPEPYASNHAGYMQRYLETGISKVIGTARQFVAQHKSGSLLPIRLAVIQQEISGARIFVGTIDPSGLPLGSADAANRMRSAMEVGVTLPLPSLAGVPRPMLVGKPQNVLSRTITASTAASMGLVSFCNGAAAASGVGSMPAGASQAATSATAEAAAAGLRRSVDNRLHNSAGDLNTSASSHLSLSDSGRVLVPEPLDGSLTSLASSPATSPRTLTSLSPRSPTGSLSSSSSLSPATSPRGPAAPLLSPRHVSAVSSPGRWASPITDRAEAEVSGATPKRALQSSLAKPKRFTLKIDTDRIVMNERLASTGGSGATVYACNVDGWQCACKELSLTSMGSDPDITSFETEVSVIERLPSHPNIVRYLFHDLQPSKLRLFMTRYHGTLRGYIDTLRKPKGPWPYLLATRHLLRIANGLVFLHKHGIMHRDLKADNIFVMLDEAKEIQLLAIGDFDTSTTKRTSKTLIGTPAWMAPEVLREETYSYKADVFSFGMVIFEVMTLERPYESLRPFLVPERILAGIHPALPPLPAEYAALKNLHTRCLLTKPDDRPDAVAVRGVLVSCLPAEELDKR